MQPIRHDVAATSSPSLLVTARDAFERGDFVACLHALDDAANLSPAHRREATLLRARALIRTARFADAVALLGPSLGSFVTVDEECTARMLHGMAVARTPDDPTNVERGRELLEDVAKAADALGAHRAIRAEIAYMTAFVHWMKRDYRSTLRYAIVAEEANADVISVRAASLRGYVAIAHERYYDALRLFRFALHAYRSCTERDADLVERIVTQIAGLEVALRSDTVTGTHHLPDEFGRLGEDVEGDVPSVFRMEVAIYDAWLYAFDDDSDNAYRKARIAEDLAPSPAWRVFALSNRAKIASAFEEHHVAREFATQAFEIMKSVAWNETREHERVGLLHLTEGLSRIDPAAAVETFRCYDELTVSIDRAVLYSDDVKMWIFETYVRGLVCRIRGDVTEAWEHFKAVHRAAMRVSIVWRAVLALVELDATPIGVRPRGEHYLQSAALLVRKHFPRSFVARRIGPWMAAYRDPIAANLRAQPREVMRHLLTGRNAKEIASAMGLSEDTVKGYIKTLFRAFSVNSTPQLLVACYERGIGSPSWWNTLSEPNPPPIAGERSLTAPRPSRRSRRSA